MFVFVNSNQTKTVQNYIFYLFLNRSRSKLSEYDVRVAPGKQHTCTCTFLTHRGPVEGRKSD